MHKIILFEIDFDSKHEKLEILFNEALMAGEAFKATQSIWQ